MNRNAPLQVTVEIRFESGPTAGQRRFRLSHSLGLPPEIQFHHPLPLEGEGSGQVRFTLPEGTSITALATLYFDPEHPERGSHAELLDVSKTDLAAIETYIDQRLET